MDELLHKYWYVLLGALVLLYVLAKKGGGATTQLAGSNFDVMGAAQLAEAGREADQTARFGFANSLLSYDLNRTNLGQQLDLAKISADAQAQALSSQNQLAQLQLSLQNQQFNSSLSAQQQQLQNAFNIQGRNNLLGALTTGIQSILPTLFGSAVSNGGLFGGALPGGIFSFNPASSANDFANWVDAIQLGGYPQINGVIDASGLA